MWKLWLIIAGLFFVGEIATVGFLILLFKYLYKKIKEEI